MTFKNLSFLLHNKKCKLLLLLYLFLTIIVSLIETLGITSIAVFVGILAKGDLIFKNLFLKINFVPNFNFILFFITFLFILKFSLVTIFNFIESYIQQKLIKDFREKIFINFLYMPYLNNIKMNSAVLVREITNDIPISISLVFIIIKIIKEFLILFLIFIVLIFSGIDFIFIIFLGLSFLSILFYLSIRKKLQNLSAIFLSDQTKMIDLVYNAFGSLKETKVFRLEQKLSKKFLKSIAGIYNFEFFKNFINSLPRYLFEFIAVIFIVAIAYTMKISQYNQTFILQVIALIGASSIRLIPSFNILTSSFSLIKSYKKIFLNFHNKYCHIDFDKNYKKRNINFINFKKDFEIKNLNFNYISSKKTIFQDTNLKIQKNKVIGIYGPSGSGKTTLIDIILGIIDVKYGDYYTDKKYIPRKNKKLILSRAAYVSQTPFFINGTIKDNIIFGRSEQNSQKKIKKIINISNLDALVSDLPKGLETNIGNSGFMLSGGQRQRVIIARALYGNPSIIVFDEATNALDNQTENKIISEIFKLKKFSTIIIVSHALDIIKKCDIIIEIKNHTLITNYK